MGSINWTQVIVAFLVGVAASATVKAAFAKAKAAA